MFKLEYKNMLIEYNYDDASQAYSGKVVNIDEHIQHRSPSLTELKSHLFKEVDALLKFNHGNGF